MSQNLQELCDQLLTAARRAGAHDADAIVVSGRSVSVDVLNGKLEHAERAEGTDIGLRVLLGNRQAVASASDTRPDTIAQMAERAVAMAREAPEDPYAGLADQSELSKSWNIAALQLADPGPEPEPAELQNLAQRTESAALAVDGISQVQSTSAGYGSHSIHLATSNGFSGGYSKTGSSISCAAISGEGAGMERDYFGDSRTFAADLESPENIGRLAGERTIERIGSRQPKTGTFPVLFDERISSSLIGHLLAAINGSSIARGSSWLRDGLGQLVLPSHLSLVEEPHRPRVAGSKPFDGEGLPTANRTIVEDGILTGWILDLATARKLGLKSSANAARGTSSPPSPSAGNVSMTQGKETRDDLIRDMGTGLIVTSMIGATINSNTGDYSRGASGLWVENGKVKFPVNECTVAGNLRDMLARIVPANDARQHLSRVVPSLLIDGMTIAGA